jgi:hypothetical protein
MTAAGPHDARVEVERQQWFVALDFGVADRGTVAPAPPAEPPGHDVLP